MVGMVPWPVRPGACHSFLCEAEAVATWTAGCELRSPVRAPTTTSFYTINKFVHKIHGFASVYLAVNHYQRNLS